jgi:hypothetical protein
MTISDALSSLRLRHIVTGALVSFIAYACFHTWVQRPIERLIEVCDIFRALNESAEENDQDVKQALASAVRACERLPDDD